MKRFQKFSLCVAGVSIFLGIGMIGAGTVMGAFDHPISDWNIIRKGGEIVRTENFTETYEDVDELDFDFDFCSVTIEKGDEFRITSDGTDASLKSYVKNGKWYIKSEDVFGFLGIRLGGESENNIVITLPETMLKKVKLDIGAGRLNIDGIQTEKLELDVGAGSAELKNAVAQKAEMECGMGQLTYNGILQDTSSIECSMGKIKLELSGKEEDYQYELECDMGKIVLNGTEHQGIEKKIKSGDPDAPKIKVECGMGQVDLLFQQP